jgi:hypothetical protein
VPWQKTTREADGFTTLLQFAGERFTIYDDRTTSPDADLDRIASKPILFRIVVKHPYPKSWELIGWSEIEERLTQPIVQFRMEVGPLRRWNVCLMPSWGGLMIH